MLAALVVPAGAAASPARWHTYRVKTAGNLAAARCPSNSVCVAITQGGQVLTTRNASASKPVWKLTAGLKVTGPEESSEQRTAYNLACPSVHLCVTSKLSQIITTTNPTGPAALKTFSARGDRLNSITCRSSSFCVATGERGLVAVLRRGA